MTQAITKQFKEVFTKEPEHIYSAAGRVNLIGEHIDYCGGKVLPAALDMCSMVAIAKNDTNKIRIATEQPHAYVELDIDHLDQYKKINWGSYQAGVA